jgi:hypothetical protein
MNVPKRAAVFGLVALLVAIWSGPAEAKRKKSTPEDRAKAVRLARELENAPLASDAVDKRRWIMEWYEKIPDITVTICDVLGPFPEEEHPFLGELLIQLVASSGAYVIEHPDKAEDMVAVQTAGIEGVLKAYERFVKEMPEDRLAHLDDLLSRRAEGSLREYMSETVPKACS